MELIEVKEILRKASVEVDIQGHGKHIALFEADFERVAIELLKKITKHDVVGRSEQSCKHPDSCAMGYYHQIGDYYCSKCQNTGLQD